MNAKLEKILAGTLSALNLGVSVSLFFPFLPSIVLFSFFLPLIFGIQSLRKTPLAFLIAFFATFLGVFSLSKESKQDLLLFLVLVLILWGGMFLIHLFQEKVLNRQKKDFAEQDEMGKESAVMLREIRFYEEKKQELEKRAAQRRQLAQAARELGSSLDPSTIQEKTHEIARQLFAGKRVQISLGQNPD